MLVVLIRRKRCRSVLTDGAAECLLKCDISMLFVHNSGVTSVLLFHEFKYFYAASHDGCDLWVRKWICMLPRGPQLFCIVGLSLSQLFMAADRAICTYHKQLERQTLTGLKVVFIIVLCTVSAASVYYAQGQVDMFEYVNYCTNTSAKSKDQMSNIFVVILVVDVISAAALLVLSRKNMSDLKRNTHAFRLNSKYQLRHNVASTRFLFWLVSTRLAVLGVSHLAGVLVRQLIDTNTSLFRLLLEGVYIHPWFALVLAILLSRQERFVVDLAEVIPVSNEAALHFTQLEKQWSAKL